jgi:hypothetical protein
MRTKARAVGHSFGVLLDTGRAERGSTGKPAREWDQGALVNKAASAIVFYAGSHCSFLWFWTSLREPRNAADRGLFLLPRPLQCFLCSGPRFASPELAASRRPAALQCLPYCGVRLRRATIPKPPGKGGGRRKMFERRIGCVSDVAPSAI